MGADYLVFIAHETATTDDGVDRLATAGTEAESVSTDCGTEEADDDSGGFLARLLGCRPPTPRFRFPSCVPAFLLDTER